MTPEKKAQWIAALKSGKYVQGSHALRRRRYDGEIVYCCLGVLADLDGLPWEPIPDSELFCLPTRENIKHYYEGSKDLGSNLPIRLVEKLAVQNDRDTSFTDIADWIEEIVKTEE